ncbi:MAG: tyrosine-type recombinase/integrase, partial [Culicoidibacterales bacterium]
MSIFKDDQRGTWFFVTRYTDMQGKKKQKKQRGFKTKREATVAEREFLNTVQNGSFFHADTTIDMILDLYIADKQKIVKGSTFRSLKGKLNYRIRPFFKDMQMKDIRNTHILAFHQELFHPPSGSDFIPLQFSTVKEYHSIFVAMIKYAEKHYELPSISYRFQAPKRQHSLEYAKTKELRFYTFDQFKDLINHIDSEYDFERNIIILLYFTGLRINELLALTYEHIDLENKKIFVRQNVIYAHKDYLSNKCTLQISTPKTASSVRDISIPDFAFGIIQKIYNHDKQMAGFSKSWFVFSLAKTKPYHYTTLQFKYNKIMAQTHLQRITLHDFRHSHASLLINMGADAMLV